MNIKTERYALLKFGEVSDPCAFKIQRPKKQKCCK